LEHSIVIQNQSQYRNTKVKLKEFEQALVELDKNPDKLSPRLLAAQKAGLQVWLDRLKSQIAEYETLQQGLSSLEVVSLQELPIALIKARISLGMSQKDLAEKIGTQEQQIQRYEANHYAAISFDRMMKIAEALGIALKHPIQIAIVDRMESRDRFAVHPPLVIAKGKAPLNQLG
jgi:HTH-type transcriptional regulator / antitoxin HipB